MQWAARDVNASNEGGTKGAKLAPLR